MEYLSTSISAILAARRDTTPPPPGVGGMLSNEMLAPAREREGSNAPDALEITNPRMDTRKPRLYSPACEFLFAFIPLFEVMIGKMNRDGG